MTAVRTLCDVDAGPLPHPLGGAWFFPWGRLGRLAQQLSTLAQGACLAPVGQEAPMPQALKAVRQDMQQKTPDKLMRLQRHGLHLIALAPIAIREAHATVADIQEAMIGNRDAVDIAAQTVKNRGWPGARPLGVHHPRLAIELVEEVREACGGPEPGRLLGAAQRLCAVGLL